MQDNKGSPSQNDQPITPPPEKTRMQILKYLNDERCLSAYMEANSELNFACVSSFQILSLISVYFILSALRFLNMSYNVPALQAGWGKNTQSFG
jgi:hypothetical protein